MKINIKIAIKKERNTYITRKICKYMQKRLQRKKRSQGHEGIAIMQMTVALKVPKSLWRTSKVIYINKKPPHIHS